MFGTKPVPLYIQDSLHSPKVRVAPPSPGRKVPLMTLTHQGSPLAERPTAPTPYLLFIRLP